MNDTRSTIATWITITALILVALALVGCAYPVQEDLSTAQLSLSVSGGISSSAIGAYEELNLTVFAIEETLLEDDSAIEYQSYVADVFLKGGESVQAPDASTLFAATNLRTGNTSNFTELTGLQPGETYLVGLVANEVGSENFPAFAGFQSIRLEGGTNQASLSVNADVAGKIENISQEFSIDLTPNLLADLDYSLDQFLVFLGVSEATVIITSALDQTASTEFVDYIKFVIEREELAECDLDCSGNGATTYEYPGSETPEPEDIVSMFIATGLPSLNDDNADPGFSDLSNAEQVAFTIPPNAEPGFEEDIQFEYELISTASLTIEQLDPGDSPPHYNLSWSITLDNARGTTISGELLNAASLGDLFSLELPTGDPE